MVGSVVNVRYDPYGKKVLLTVLVGLQPTVLEVEPEDAWRLARALRDVALKARAEREKHVGVLEVKDVEVVRG